MTYTTIEFDIDQSIARITLNRPDVLNALNVPLVTELRAAIESVRDDTSVRCLLVTGNGRGFCAGADLKQRMSSMEGEKPDLGMSIEVNYNPIISRVEYAADPQCMCGKRYRRRRRRRRESGISLRHSYRRPLGEFPAGLYQDRFDPGLRQHLVVAAPGRQCARQSAGHAGGARPR